MTAQEGAVRTQHIDESVSQGWEGTHFRIFLREFLITGQFKTIAWNISVNEITN